MTNEIEQEEGMLMRKPEEDDSSRDFSERVKDVPIEHVKDTQPKEKKEMSYKPIQKGKNGSLIAYDSEIGAIRFGTSDEMMIRKEFEYAQKYPDDYGTHFPSDVAKEAETPERSKSKLEDVMVKLPQEDSRVGLDSVLLDDDNMGALGNETSEESTDLKYNPLTDEREAVAEETCINEKSRERIRPPFVERMRTSASYMGMIGMPLAATILTPVFAGATLEELHRWTSPRDILLAFAFLSSIFWLPGGLAGAYLGGKIAEGVEKSVRQGIENERKYCVNEKCTKKEIDRVDASYCPQCGDGVEE